MKHPNNLPALPVALAAPLSAEPGTGNLGQLAPPPGLIAHDQGPASIRDRARIAPPEAVIRLALVDRTDGGAG